MIRGYLCHEIACAMTTKVSSGNVFAPEKTNSRSLGTYFEGQSVGVANQDIALDKDTNCLQCLTTHFRQSV